jgi:hypothetical protein
MAQQIEVEKAEILQKGQSTILDNSINVASDLQPKTTRHHG